MRYCLRLIDNTVWQSSDKRATAFQYDVLRVRVLYNVHLTDFIRRIELIVLILFYYGRTTSENQPMPNTKFTISVVKTPASVRPPLPPPPPKQVFQNRNAQCKVRFMDFVYWSLRQIKLKEQITIF